jgi:hypothetical protein
VDVQFFCFFTQVPVVVGGLCMIARAFLHS